MPLIRRVYKQGNSYVVSLPEWILEQMKMEVGDRFTVEPIGRKEIRLRPYWENMSIEGLERAEKDR